MTTNEKDELLGALVREKSEASRSLACFKAKLQRYDRQFQLARAIISQDMRLVASCGNERVGYWDCSAGMEDLSLPSNEEFILLVTEIERVQRLIEERKRSISEIAPGC